MSSEWVRRLAREDERAASINPGMLIAVVGKEDLTYGLLRMWQMQAEGPALETAVFRNLNEAMDWIRDRLAMKQAQPDAATDNRPPADA